MYMPYFFFTLKICLVTPPSACDCQTAALCQCPCAAFERRNWVCVAVILSIVPAIVRAEDNREQISDVGSDVGARWLRTRDVELVSAFHIASCELQLSLPGDKKFRKSAVDHATFDRWTIPMTNHPNDCNFRSTKYEQLFRLWDAKLHWFVKRRIGAATDVQNRWTICSYST